MSTQNPLSELSPSDEQHAAYYRRVLHELIEMGTEIARAVHREATAEEAVADDATVRFDRVCRCVRRSILLARSLDAPVVARGAGLATARRRVLRTLEDQIDRKEDGEAAERLHGELLERLERPELDEDLACRPVEEVIREIGRDLGLEQMPGFHSWKRRTPGDVAVLSARARRSAPGDRAGAVGPAGRGRAPPA